MIYTMAAHPTKYKGITFRSRLEATWAARFTIEKISWECEPIDLAGWVPDFRVTLKNGEEVFAEVKPVDKPDDWPDLEKMRVGANENGHILLCGASGSAWLWSFNHNDDDGLELDSPRIRGLIYGIEAELRHPWTKAKERTRWRGPRC